MIFETFKWLAVALSLWGTVLNIRHDRRCFYLWAVGNAGWVAIDLAHGVYQQAVLQFLYLLLSVWGIVAWKRKEP